MPGRMPGGEASIEQLENSQRRSLFRRQGGLGAGRKPGREAHIRPFRRIIGLLGA